MAWPALPRKTNSRLERLLDALATRLGMVLVVGALLGTCIAAGLYGQKTVERLERDHAIFRDSQIRNGYVAMSDVQRLVLISQEALLAGEMTPALEEDFRAASDIIYVRIDNFSRMIRNGHNMASGAAFIAALNDFLAIADGAMERGAPDPAALSADLLASAEVARQNLVRFLDDMRRKSDRVLDLQSQAVGQQQVIVTATLLGLTLLSAVSIQFLRREVLGRRAREEAEEQVAFLAFNDPLTELPNRSQFQARLQDWLDIGGELALLFVDLDDFKMVNDTYGHVAGDEVLIHVGRQLSQLADTDAGFAARLGGDEFALVMPSNDLDDLSRLCVQILNCAHDPVVSEGEAISFGLSIGMATTRQAGDRNGLTVDLFSRVTDFALYESKSKGRNTYSVYDQSLEGRFLERRAMVEDLPNAVHQGELRVFLQPKVNLASAETSGFEALVRWQRDGKLIPPNDFIQVAEETGQIQKIDHFVLDQSTKVIAAWNEAHGTRFSVSVNLSGLHFATLRIVGWVEEALAASGLPPHLLTLEITETVELRDWGLTRDILYELRALGVRISIDDFGSGYSSLAYLKAINADELKIDRSLVTHIAEPGQARELLASVLDIAKTMKLKVVVEGVETAQQVDVLSEMGVQTVQGYFFGRPVEMEEALTAQTPEVLTDQAVS